MPGPTPGALRLLFGEAKDVLAAQLDALSSMESKAEAVARFNLLIVGFVVAGSAVTAGRAEPATGFALPLLAGGFVLLVFSTVMAAASYLKHDVMVGPSERDLVAALDIHMDERQLLRQAVELYGRGAHTNYDRLRTAATRLKWALWALIGGILVLSAAAISLIPL